MPWLTHRRTWREANNNQRKKKKKIFTLLWLQSEKRVCSDVVLTQARQTRKQSTLTDPLEKKYRIFERSNKFRRQSKSAICQFLVFARGTVRFLEISVLVCISIDFPSCYNVISSCCARVGSPARSAVS